MKRIFSNSQRNITTVTCVHTHVAWHHFKLLIAKVILIVEKLMYHSLACKPPPRFLISNKSPQSDIPFKSSSYTVGEIATS